MLVGSDLTTVTVGSGGPFRVRDGSCEDVRPARWRGQRHEPARASRSVRAGERRRLAGPLVFLPAQGREPRVRGTSVPREPARRASRGPPRGRERRAARDLPARRRPGRDAAGLAARGAQGPGGGGAHVRRRRPAEGTLVRPVLRLALADVLRRVRGGARPDARDRRDPRRGGHLRGRAGAGLLLLVQRRSHVERARRVRQRPALPRLGRRSVGRGVAAPSLGATDVHREDARPRPSACPARWSTRGSSRERRPARRSWCSRPPAGATTAIRLTDVRARLGLRSSTFRLGTLRLAAPAGKVAPGSQLRLTGTARDVDRPRLEKRAPGGAWVKGPRLASGSRRHVHRHVAPRGDAPAQTRRRRPRRRHR